MVASSLSETLAEMLLTGAVDLDDGFDDIAEVLSAVKDSAVSDAERDFSHLFVAAVEESRLTPLEQYAREREPHAQDWPARLVSRAAMAVAAVVVLVMASGGMAYAANGAKPGDLLYGLDRALEAMGVGDGGAEERLAESLALVASGVEPSDSIDGSEVVAGSPTDGLGQAAPIPSIDGAVDTPQQPQPPEPLREGRLSEDAAEDAEALDGDDESRASIGAGPVDQPPPENPDEPVATDDDASGDTSDPANTPNEVGDDTTDGPDDDEAGDPTDLTEEPPDQSPTPETPEPGETPGPDEALRAVIIELQGIVDDNPGSPVADKVEDAVAKANTALGELEKTPRDDQAAAGNIQGAIGDLEAAIADGLLDPGHGNQLIDQLADIIRQLESPND